MVVCVLCSKLNVFGMSRGCLTTVIFQPVLCIFIIYSTVWNSQISVRDVANSQLDHSLLSRWLDWTIVIHKRIDIYIYIETVSTTFLVGIYLSISLGVNIPFFSGELPDDSELVVLHQRPGERLDHHRHGHLSKPKHLDQVFCFCRRNQTFRGLVVNSTVGSRDLWWRSSKMRRLTADLEDLKLSQWWCTSTISNKKLLGSPGIATRSKDATRGSWPYY